MDYIRLVNEPMNRSRKTKGRVHVPWPALCSLLLEHIGHNALPAHPENRSVFKAGMGIQYGTKFRVTGTALDESWKVRNNRPVR